MAIVKKSVVLHPVIERLVRQAQAAMIQTEPPVDATYSAAVNFLLLAGGLELIKEGGWSDEVVPYLRSFLRDRKAIDEVNLHDRLAAVNEAFARLEPPPSKAQPESRSR